MVRSPPVTPPRASPLRNPTVSLGESGALRNAVPPRGMSTSRTRRARGRREPRAHRRELERNGGRASSVVGAEAGRGGSVGRTMGARSAPMESPLGTRGPDAHASVFALGPSQPRDFACRRGFLRPRGFRGWTSGEVSEVARPRLDRGSRCVYDPAAVEPGEPGTDATRDGPGRAPGATSRSGSEGRWDLAANRPQNEPDPGSWLPWGRASPWGSRHESFFLTGRRRSLRSDTNWMLSRSPPGRGGIWRAASRPREADRRRPGSRDPAWHLDTDSLENPRR